jgi:hypothetical protein
LIVYRLLHWKLPAQTINDVLIRARAAKETGFWIDVVVTDLEHLAAVRTRFAQHIKEIAEAVEDVGRLIEDLPKPPS